MNRRHLSIVPALPPWPARPAPEPARAPAGEPGRPADVYALRRMRCECRVCGAHTIAAVCFTVGGSCQNCGSYDLHPIAEIKSDR